jgi:hypothetical protein
MGRLLVDEVSSLLSWQICVSLRIMVIMVYMVAAKDCMVYILRNNLRSILVLGMQPFARIYMYRVFKVYIAFELYRCRFVNKVEDCWGWCFKPAINNNLPCKEHAPSNFQELRVAELRVFIVAFSLLCPKSSTTSLVACNLG